jgi:DNA-binding IclR family transcriptional regulator
MPTEDTLGVKSLLRALSLIDILSSSPDGQSLGEIARAAQLPPSTVHRLLQSLQQMGYVIQDHATAHYALGEKLILLGRKAEQQRDVRNIARPHLEHLARATNETVSLTTILDNSVVQLDHVDSPNMLKVTWDSGQRFPIHASASGKVFLAYLPEADRNRILKTIKLQPFTKRTIVDRRRTLVELRTISSRGYALDDAEREEGVRCVAAPIFNATGLVVAAVSISGPSLRLSLSKLDELAIQVVQTAQAISASLGSSVDSKSMQ